MLNLDIYVEDRITIQLLGRTVTVKEPSVKMYDEINQIEKNLTKTNYATKRLQIARLFLNNNDECVSYSEEELSNVPLVVIEKVCEEVVKMRENVENDPN